MLEIDLKLLPFGDRSRSKVLYRIQIANDASGDLKSGNYTASIRNDTKGKVLDTCKLKDFPRLDKNALHLLYIILGKFVRRYNVRNKKNVQTSTEEGLLQQTPEQTSST